MKKRTKKKYKVSFWTTYEDYVYWILLTIEVLFLLLCLSLCLAKCNKECSHARIIEQNTR
jgi:hypothetical protein